MLQMSRKKSQRIQCKQKKKKLFTSHGLLQEYKKQNPIKWSKRLKTVKSRFLSRCTNIDRTIRTAATRKKTKNKKERKKKEQRDFIQRDESQKNAKPREKTNK